MEPLGIGSEIEIDKTPCLIIDIFFSEDGKSLFILGEDVGGDIYELEFRKVE